MYTTKYRQHPAELLQQHTQTIINVFLQKKIYHAPKIYDVEYFFIACYNNSINIYCLCKEGEVGNNINFVYERVKQNKQTKPHNKEHTFKRKREGEKRTENFSFYVSPLIAKQM